MYPRKWLGYIICLLALLMATGRVLAQSQPPGQASHRLLGSPASGYPPDYPIGSFVSKGQRDLLYVASPATHHSKNAAGIYVFDVWDHFNFVKRIHTFDYPAWQDPEEADEVKGIAISSVTGRAYLGTYTGLSAFDLITEKLLWKEKVDGAGSDRLAISPDGKLLYVPKRDAEGWVVVDADTGREIKKIYTESTHHPHNTIYGLDGSRVFGQASESRYLNVFDTKDHTTVQKVGPFGTEKELAYTMQLAKDTNSKPLITKPFTVNGKGTLVFVNVNGLMGFEVGDVRTGKVIAHVEVTGYPWTREQVHGEGFPSHGIALSPDETEIWLTDNVHGILHIFDATVMPPKQISAVTLPYRLGPGESEGRAYPYWVTMGLDGKYVYASTGDVIDRTTRQVVAALKDEWGRPVRSEKIIEVLWVDGKPVRNSDQFGRGMVTGDSSMVSSR
jgi:DNA-binding beta-propeller fold protein YncE